VEVGLDGDRVGLIGRAISEQVYDLVTFAADKDRVLGTRAIVEFGSPCRSGGAWRTRAN
jgi:hypothetical protein